MVFEVMFERFRFSLSSLLDQGVQQRNMNTFCFTVGSCCPAFLSLCGMQSTSLWRLVHRLVSPKTSSSGYFQKVQPSLENINQFIWWSATHDVFDVTNVQNAYQMVIRPVCGHRSIWSCHCICFGSIRKWPDLCSCDHLLAKVPASSWRLCIRSSQKYLSFATTSTTAFQENITNMRVVKSYVTKQMKQHQKASRRFINAYEGCLE